MIHAFTFFNPDLNITQYYVLDVESGAVHALDGFAYQIVEAMEEGRDVSSTGLSDDVIREVQEELQELQDAKLLYTKPFASADDIYAGDTVVKSICLHIAHDCNLRCKYCFADSGEFGGERMLMPLEVGKAALDFLIKNSGNRRNLEVDFFGGEPLINFDVVKAIVEYGRMLEKQNNKEIHYTITTNGLALDEEKTDFINKEMFNVVLSLDGRRHIHDELRPTVGGKGSYDIILPKICDLIKKRGEGEYYVRGTYTNKNLDFTQDVKALRDEGFLQISLEPVVLAPQSPYAIREEHVEQVIREYDKLCQFYIQSLKEGAWFNFFHFMIDLEQGPCLKKRIKGCGAGTEYVAVTPDGGIYPCHQFAGEKELTMGNVLTQTFDLNKRSMFLNNTLLHKEACKTCWAKYFCSGGCAANAWKFNSDISRPEKISCKLMRKRTECALGLAMMNKEAEGKREKDMV